MLMHAILLKWLAHKLYICPNCGSFDLEMKETAKGQNKLRLPIYWIVNYLVDAIIDPLNNMYN